MRHGEVYNPQRVLYGRLPGFRLSDDGRRMADAAARHIQSLARPIGSLISSPLQRTLESSESFTKLFGIEPIVDERVIEPANVFEGTRMKKALRNPLNWRHIRQPSRPSWGEPYVSIVARMREAMDAVWDAVPSGDVVIVSHQAPIWLTHLAVADQPFRHDPRSRRCALSSVTSFERRSVRGDEGWAEVDYVEPATLAGAVDVGAV